MISKDDYIAWLNHPVTEAFFTGVKSEGDILVTRLAQNAGLEPLRDRFICGSIDTIRWISEWQPVFVEEQIEETEEDES
jgi:hypothetical protein